MNIVWSNDALHDLRDIVSYIHAQNPDAAKRMAALFSDATETLAPMPYIGRTGRVQGTREWVVHPNYIMVYKVGVSSLHILRILHGRRRYP